MKDFLRNIPFINWLNWKIKVIILLLKNRDKHLKIDSSVRFSDVVFSDYNALYKNVDIYTSKIGRFVYIAPDTKIFDTQVGSFCSIGPGCKIGLGDHPVDHISTSPVFFSPHNQCLINFHQDKMFNENLPITIGNDVWIGANVIILNGIIIGDGAIVAAGAVVTKNVPPYAIVAGVPAKILKYRFSFDNITILQKLKWWDKDIDWLKENASLFSNPHLFFNTYAK